MKFKEFSKATEYVAMERPNDWYVFFSVYGSHAVYNYAFRLDKKTGQALDFAPINEGTYFE